MLPAGGTLGLPTTQRRMVARRRAPLGRLVAMCLLFTLAGCMDDAPDDDAGNGGDGGTTDEPADGGPPDDGSDDDMPRTHEVDIQGFQFRPGTLEVNVGDTVRWTNRDSAVHTATGDGFDTGNLGQGESGEVTFTAAGSFDYFCKIHPAMQGTIVVS